MQLQEAFKTKGMDERLCDMIESMGRIHVERDTLYNQLKVYTPSEA